MDYGFLGLPSIIHCFYCASLLWVAVVAVVASFTMNNNSDQTEFNDDDSLSRNEYAPLAEHSSVDSESALT